MKIIEKPMREKKINLNTYRLKAIHLMLDPDCSCGRIGYLKVRGIKEGEFHMKPVYNNKIVRRTFTPAFGPYCPEQQAFFEEEVRALLSQRKEASEDEFPSWGEFAEKVNDLPLKGEA